MKINNVNLNISDFNKGNIEVLKKTSFDCDKSYRMIKYSVASGDVKPSLESMKKTAKMLLK